MASIVTERGVVHYETIGRGRPVLLLHCWLGSWANWRDSMEMLARSYRVHALDFWGFGESSKQSYRYEIADYVAMVQTFMERMGIARAHRISYVGELGWELYVSADQAAHVFEALVEARRA